MRFDIELWLFVLFLTKEITSIRASYSASKKSDITKYLNLTIQKLFHSAKSRVLTCLLKNIQNHEPKTYEYNLTRKVQGFRDHIVFRNVTFSRMKFYSWTTKYMEYDFLNNKIQIGLDHADVEINCDIYSDKDTYYSSFQTDIEFNDNSYWDPNVDYSCIINVRKLSKAENILQIDMQVLNSSYIRYHNYFNDQINEAVKRNNDLMEEIKSKIPSILLENMNHNEKLIQALNKSYGFRPKRHLLTRRKNFTNNEYQYHYRIPTAQYFCFKLINITISGLSNFQSLKHRCSPDKKPIHTLWIKDIRGNTILDYGRESESPLELNFHADYLSISKDRFSESYYGRGFKVGAHWASVSRAKEDIPLTNVQSEGIWRSIESALAFSLKPESIVRKLDETETPLKQKCSEIPSSLCWEDVKQSYKKWIPFNDDYEYEYIQNEKYSSSAHAHVSSHSSFLNNMICNIKLWFFVLFLTKEITSIRASYSASEKSDITKYLNSTIHKIFRSAKGVSVTFLLKKITNHEPKTYEYNLTRKVQGFRDQIIFRNVTFPSLEFGIWARSANRKYIEYDFLNNKIQIGSISVYIEFKCDIYSDKDIFYSSFQGEATFDHPSTWPCFINVTKLPKTNLENIFQIDMPLPKSAEFGYSSYKQYEAVARNNDLMEEIKSKLPSMLIENMNHNEKLIRALNKSYGFRPKRHLLAKRKNFSHNEYQYHYRIPAAKYFCFKLINISISGLSNFQSLKQHYSPDMKPIHTLWINDIRGKATLDYGRESESPLELNFYADYLSISKDRFTETYYGRGFKVGAHWASVSRAKEDIPLTIVQSEGIWRSIESALAFSLKPESIVRKLDEMETPMKQKCSEIPSSLSWEDVKQSYKKWIPFNDD